MTPWTIALQAPMSMEFSRQQYWSRSPFPSPGNLSNPGIEPRSPVLQADSLPSESPGKSKVSHILSLSLNHKTLSSHNCSVGQICSHWEPQAILGDEPGMLVSLKVKGGGYWWDSVELMPFWSHVLGGQCPEPQVQEQLSSFSCYF